MGKIKVVLGETININIPTVGLEPGKYYVEIKLESPDGRIAIHPTSITIIKPVKEQKT